MKRNAIVTIGLMVLTLMSVAGCKGNSSGKSLLTPTSSGAPYEVLVVASTEDLQSGAYEALNNVLIQDIPGLPQSEKSFKVSKVVEDDFSRALKYCRNIIIIKIDRIYSQGKIKFSRNVYSAPQVIMSIQAADVNQFKQYVNENRQSIIDFLTRVEMNREIDLLKKTHNMNVSQKVKEMFDCDVWVPQELVKRKEAKNFFWATTDRGERDMSIVIYSYPYRDVNTFTSDYFFAKRDSVMKANIPGPREGQYMSTARPYVTVKDSEVKGKYAQIARGLWEMTNYDMGGPFVSISRVDEQNQRVIVAEAFIYAPGDEKRNLMRRMEAAIYTLRLPDEIDVDRFSYAIEEVTIEPDSLN